MLTDHQKTEIWSHPEFFKRIDWLCKKRNFSISFLQHSLRKLKDEVIDIDIKTEAVCSLIESEFIGLLSMAFNEGVGAGIDCTLEKIDEVQNAGNT
jgi:hypothetical protein